MEAQRISADEKENVQGRELTVLATVAQDVAIQNFNVFRKVLISDGKHGSF